MTRTLIDFTIDQGADWAKRVPLLDEAGAAADLTGYDARMQIREHDTDDVILADLRVGAGITIDAANGIVTLALTAAQTTAITVALAVYDLKMIDGAGHGQFPIGGSIIIRPSVTR